MFKRHLLLATLSTLTISTCFAHTKPVQTTRQLKNFGEVNIGGNAKLTIHVGKTRMLTINANAKKAQCILTDINGSVLYIYTLSRPDCKNSKPIQLTLNTPKLNGIMTHGNNSTTIYNIDNKTFLTYSSGRSHINVRGKSRSLNSVLTGEASVDANQLQTGGALISASGNSQMQLNTTGVLFVRGSGNAAISYSGTPKKLIRSLSGTSSVNHTS